MRVVQGGLMSKNNRTISFSKELDTPNVHFF